MSVKAYVLDEDENCWRGFLYDHDCRSEIVRKFISPGEEAGPKPDQAIVEEARKQDRTVVTSNGDDFIRCVREAQKKNNFQRCEDCWGLVILPTADLTREHALKKANLKNGVQLGGNVIPWKAIGLANLCVNVRNDGRVEVRKFERCQFRQQDMPIKTAWYGDLPSL